jgi:hypothetical protein
MISGTYTKLDGQIVEELVSSQTQPLFVNKAALTQCVSVIGEQVDDGQDQVKDEHQQNW